MQYVNKYVLDNVTVLHLDITLWSGCKKLRPEDLKGADLPPEKLASLGSKRIYDPKALQVFTNRKKQAERVCLEAGTRFLSGFAIPNEKVPGVLLELNDLSTKFNSDRADFLQSYQDKLDSWIDEAGEWADIIRAAIEPVESVAEKLSYSFAPIKITAAVEPATSDNSEPLSEVDALADQLLENQVNGLAAQLLREVGLAARSAFKSSFQGKTEVTRKALRPINAMKEKLKGLAFVAPQQITGLLDNIQAALDAIPKSGPVTGAPLMGLIGVLSELGDLNGFVLARENGLDDEQTVSEEEESFVEPEQVASVPETPLEDTERIAAEQPAVEEEQNEVSAESDATEDSIPSEPDAEGESDPLTTPVVGKVPHSRTVSPQICFW